MLRADAWGPHCSRDADFPFLIRDGRMGHVNRVEARLIKSKFDSHDLSRRAKDGLLSRDESEHADG
jgi:hypothetical protein